MFFEKMMVHTNFVFFYCLFMLNLWVIDVGDLDVASTLPVRELARKWRDRSS